VRHLISLPAGMGKMNLTKFIVYTLVGAGLRNTFLALVGKVLKENREEVMKYSKIVDIVVLVILVGIVARFIYRQVSTRTKKRRNQTTH
jgi:membrane protein DedA with SNARE-associated domain